MAIFLKGGEKASYPKRSAMHKRYRISTALSYEFHSIFKLFTFLKSQHCTKCLMLNENLCARKASDIA